jgi:uncharacterized protein
MSERDNVELVKRIYFTFAQGKVEEMLQMFSEDLDFQHPMPQSIWPWAGHRKGRQGLAEFVKGVNEIIEFEQFEPREFIAQGECVVVLSFERGRVKTTGVAFDNPYVHVFKIKNGKAVQMLIFEDTAPIIAALQGYRK